MTARNRELVNLIAVGMLTGARLRQRLHRAAGRDLGRVGLVRADLPRPVPGRARGRPVHGAVGRPVPAPARRPADRDRADRDLPARPERRVPPGLLDRRRGGGVRAHAARAAHATSACSRATSTSSGSPRSGCSILPALPHFGTTHQRRPALGQDRAAAVPAGRAREGRADRLPRRLPAREARGAGAGPAEGLRAAAPDLGRGDARSSSRRTTSAARSSSSGSSSRCSTSRPGARSTSRSGSGCSSPAQRSPTRAIARVQERVDCWLHPWDDVHGACYQTVQGSYAIANGQFGGTGLGRGTFTTTSGTDLIPYINSDFIYSALAQELGLIGISAVLLAYMVFALRGFRDGGRRAGRLLEAARRRTDVRLRAADVHQRRRAAP